MAQSVLFWILFCSSFSSVAADTVLKLYRPYGDAINQAVPTVKSTLKGQCISQSHLIVREDAWRCDVGGETFDPCFIKAGDNRTEALCPQSPWIGDSVHIMLAVPLNNAQNQTLDMSRAYPWAIELNDGERCMAIEPLQQFDHMPIRYRCTRNNVLVGHLQRCKTTWSMLKKTSSGVETVELAKAWF